MHSCYNMRMAERGIAYRLWAAIESERVRRGWTAVRMSEHIGLPRNTIARLEKSPRRPLPATVHTIADALGMDRDEAARMAGLLPADDDDGEVRLEDLAEDIKLVLDESGLPEADRFELAKILMEEWERDVEQSRRRRVDTARQITETWRRARGA